jgi:protein-disulfide isomerase
MSNRFVVILAALVIIFGGIFIFTKNKAEAPTGGSSNSAKAQPTTHTKGGNAKKVTLVEYGDFECPACYAYYPIVEQVYEKYKNDISFQFVNFPLVSIHKNALASHRAAEAASIQGKFWEMYGLLYTNRSTWVEQSNPSPIFEGFAQQLGLDVNKFKKDASSSAVNAIVQADIAKGTKLGVNSTPTFYLDGQKLNQAPQDLEGFSKLIDNAIAKKQ